MKSLAIVLALFLAGCVAIATTEKFAAQVDARIGLTEPELVKELGPPDAVYQSGEIRYLTYSHTRSGFIPGTAPSYSTAIVGNTVVSTPTGGAPAMAFTRSCKVDYEIRQGVVASTRFAGNGCRAR